MKDIRYYNFTSVQDVYFHIVNNMEMLTLKQYLKLILELKLFSCASFLKFKFSDKRTIPQLVNLIKEEYCLT